EMNLDTKISGLCTGMASRLPLLAVEMEGARPFLLEIRRDTLQTVITDFPEETQQRFFAADFYANASGSAAWSRNTMVLRDRNAITVKPGAEGFHDGTPDASGRFVVSSSEIIDLRATPPKPVKVSSFAGMSDSTVCRLDAAGRYILLCNQGQDTPNGVASVRSLDDPAKELFKLRYSSRNGGGPQFWFVSSSASLICPLAGNSQSMTGVLDFDIDSLAKQLAR
ncbi:MAG: hypothetical protein ABIT37_14215, partial [Luteolibacter sp.]